MDKRARSLLFWIIVVAVIIALVYFGTKYYFIVSLLLGNDLAVKLTPSEENFYLLNGETKTIDFETNILANPICSANCDSKFIDLSENRVIETANFNVKTGIGDIRAYQLTSPLEGMGQKYFRFEVKCRTIDTLFCPSKGTEKSKSIFFVMDFGLTKEQQESYENYKSQLSSLIYSTYFLKEKVSYLENLYFKAPNLDMIDLTMIRELKINLDELNSSLNEGKKLFENLKTDSLSILLYESQQNLYSIQNQFNIVNRTIIQNITSYNSLLDNMQSIKNQIKSYNNISLANYSLIELNSLVSQYNETLTKINNHSTLYYKELQFNLLQNNISLFKPVLDILGEKPNFNLSSLDKINISEKSSEITVSLKSLKRSCNLFNNQLLCCQNCSDNNYPVIFLHGHAFNRGVSADYALEDFQFIQNKLEDYGFLNAGALLISPQENQRDIWSEIQSPITLRASYYFDIYKNPGENSVIQTKSDTLENYALRLKDIIETAKFKTGKKKVTIVAHSMGGLVVRRYIQIYGSSDIDKFIMMGTPNNGISKTILKLCSITGSSLECRDMDEKSLFINKLNYNPAPAIPVYNFIGLGCDMEGKNGDGITTNSSTFFRNSDNFYFNGDCNSGQFRYFHNEMLYPDKYPAVFEKLRDLLIS